MGRPLNFDRVSRQESRLLSILRKVIRLSDYKLDKNMNDLIQKDGLLAIAILLMGLVSTTDIFLEKLTWLILSIVCVAIRTYLKSKKL